VTLGAKAVILSAAACGAMCQPSSRSAIDPNAMPAMISNDHHQEVSTITHQVLCSSEWSVPNVRECWPRMDLVQPSPRSTSPAESGAVF
jgi:hypothetical protein